MERNVKNRLEKFLKNFETNPVDVSDFPTVLKWYFLFHQQAANQNRDYEKRYALMTVIGKIVWDYDQKHHSSGDNALDAFEHGVMRLLPPYPTFPERVEDVEKLIKDFRLDSNSLCIYYEFEEMVEQHFSNLDDLLKRYLIFLCQDLLQKFCIDFADFYYMRQKDKSGLLVFSNDEDYQKLYNSLALPYYSNLVLDAVATKFFNLTFEKNLSKSVKVCIK